MFAGKSNFSSCKTHSTPRTAHGRPSIAAAPIECHQFFSTSPFSINTFEGLSRLLSKLSTMSQASGNQSLYSGHTDQAMASPSQSDFVPHKIPCPTLKQQESLAARPPPLSPEQYTTIEQSSCAPPAVLRWHQAKGISDQFECQRLTHGTHQATDCLMRISFHHLRARLVKSRWREIRHFRQDLSRTHPSGCSGKKRLVRRTSRALVNTQVPSGWGYEPEGCPPYHQDHQNLFWERCLFPSRFPLAPSSPATTSSKRRCLVRRRSRKSLS